MPASTQSTHELPSAEVLSLDSARARLRIAPLLKPVSQAELAASARDRMLRALGLGFVLDDDAELAFRASAEELVGLSTAAPACGVRAQPARRGHEFEPPS